MRLVLYLAVQTTHNEASQSGANGHLHVRALDVVVCACALVRLSAAVVLTDTRSRPTRRYTSYAGQHQRRSASTTGSCVQRRCQCRTPLQSVGLTEYATGSSVWHLAGVFDHRATLLQRLPRDLLEHHGAVHCEHGLCDGRCRRLNVTLAKQVRLLVTPRALLLVPYIFAHTFMASLFSRTRFRRVWSRTTTSASCSPATATPASSVH
jgi:hypothetical protein